MDFYLCFRILNKIYSMNLLIFVWLRDVNYSNVLNLLRRTERRGHVVKTPDSYSGCAVFKSRLGDRPSSLRVFVVFLSQSRQVPG